jgi:DNA-directed RNA polymerase subunit RPC12/RpoP
MEKRCIYCKKIIIEDFDKWLEENKHQEYLQCPYCWGLEKIKCQ